MNKTEKIISIVCSHFNVTYEDLQKKCRQKPLVESRQICEYLLFKHGYVSLQDIGKLMGGQSGANIHYALKKVRDGKLFNKEYANRLTILEAEVLKLD